MSNTSHSIPDTPDNDASVGPQRGCPPPSSEESRLRWAAWHQAMELSHAMLMMGLRQKIGPEGDLHAAYRQWYEQYQALKCGIHIVPPSLLLRVLEDLLIFKAASGRLIDLADIKTLYGLHQATLDYDYLRIKAEELRLPSKFWDRA